MAGRFALQHMHPLNLWIQPSPMPQCFLNSHNKALGPAIIVMKASPWKHARETTLFSIHPLNKLRKDHTCNYGTKTLIIQQCHHILHPMAQRLLSYNNVIISSQTFIIQPCHILSSISIIIQRNLPHTYFALSSTP